LFTKVVIIQNRLAQNNKQCVLHVTLIATMVTTGLKLDH